LDCFYGSSSFAMEPSVLFLENESNNNLGRSTVSMSLSFVS